jgi:hypothetical protein
MIRPRHNVNTRHRSIRELRTQLPSRSRDVRLGALARIRKQIEASGLRRGYFSLVRPLTNDPDPTCRWQATIIIGEFIESDPERVWRVARRLATSPDKDVRIAASTVLLEHLLEHHPESVSALVHQELDRGDSRFASAVALCWNFGRNRTKRMIQRVIDEAAQSVTVRPRALNSVRMR